MEEKALKIPLKITWTNKYNPILFNVVSQDKRESNGIKLFFVNISISNMGFSN